MGTHRLLSQQPVAQAKFFIEPNKIDEKIQPHIKGQMHDALWMLTQQIRNKEFIAEDAGTPIEARFLLDAQPIQAIRHRSDHIADYNVNIPLETQIERQPLICNLGLKILFAKEFVNLLEAHAPQNEVQTIINLIKTSYPLELSDADRSDYNAMEMLSVLSRMNFNGFAVYEACKEGTINIAGLDSVVSEEFKNWVDSTYSIPNTSENSWSQKSMEYKASIVPTENSNGSRKALTASEYENGRVDWFSFDRDISQDAHSGGTTTEPVMIAKVPSPVQFKGMPSDRWWEYEDKNIDLANIKTHLKDSLKLVSTEFVINYSNDWFVIPVELKTGRIAEIDAIVVKDVFGTKTVVKPATTEASSSLGQWNQFKFSNQDSMSLVDSQTLFLAPSIVQLQESSPIDKVHFLKDEMANMTWGIEKVVPGAIANGIDGDNAWEKLNTYLIENLNIKLPKQYFKKNNAEQAYQLMNSFSENWIPFIPTKKDGTSNLEIVYQRATYDRVLSTEPQINTGSKVVPRTSILKPDNNHLFINEEEISRTGIEVSSSYQRARGIDGSFNLWFGYKKQVKYLTDSSGLTYDYLTEKRSYSELKGVNVDVNSLTYAEINSALLGVTFDKVDIDKQTEDFTKLFTQADMLNWPEENNDVIPELTEQIITSGAQNKVLYNYDPSTHITSNPSSSFYRDVVLANFPKLRINHALLYSRGKKVVLDQLYIADSIVFVKHSFGFNKGKYLIEFAKAYNTEFLTLHADVGGTSSVLTEQVDYILALEDQEDLENKLITQVTGSTNNPDSSGDYMNTRILSGYDKFLNLDTLVETELDFQDIPQYSDLVDLLNSYESAKTFTHVDPPNATRAAQVEQDDNGVILVTGPTWGTGGNSVRSYTDNCKAVWNNSGVSISTERTMVGLSYNDFSGAYQSISYKVYYMYNQPGKYHVVGASSNTVVPQAGDQVVIERLDGNIYYYVIRNGERLDLVSIAESNPGAPLKLAYTGLASGTDIDIDFYGPELKLEELVASYSDLVWDILIDESADGGTGYLNDYSSTSDPAEKSLFLQNLIQADASQINSILEIWDSALESDNRNKETYMSIIEAHYGEEVSEKLKLELKNRFL